MFDYRDIENNLIASKCPPHLENGAIVDPNEYLIIEGDSIVCIDRDNNEIWIEVEMVDGTKLLGEVYEASVSTIAKPGDHVRVNFDSIEKTYHLYPHY